MFYPLSPGSPTLPLLYVSLSDLHLSKPHSPRSTHVPSTTEPPLSSLAPTTYAMPTLTSNPTFNPQKIKLQDAYWLEYGHHWVMRYASASDVRGVLLGLLVLVSFFAYGLQHTRYTTAVRYLRKAAEKNLGPKSGGNAAVRHGMPDQGSWPGLGGVLAAPPGGGRRERSMCATRCRKRSTVGGVYARKAILAIVDLTVSLPAVVRRVVVSPSSLDLSEMRNKDIPHAFLSISDVMYGTAYFPLVRPRAGLPLSDM